MSRLQGSLTVDRLYPDHNSPYPLGNLSREIEMSVQPEIRALELLAGVDSRSIGFLPNWRRTAADVLIGRRLAGKRAPRDSSQPPRRRRRPSLLRLLNNLDAQLTLASAFKAHKYVVFGGKLFVDAFTPPWPSRAFDRTVLTMGHNAGRPLEKQIPYIPAAVMSITKRCVYRCEHCYAIKTLGKKDVMSSEQLHRLMHELQKIGVGVFAWEGGEPLLRFDDVCALIKASRPESEAWLATTGSGMSADKAARLAEAGLKAAIMSLDHYEPDKHNTFRRSKKAFDNVVKGIRHFRDAGILPSVAVCATKDLMSEGSDGLFRYLELAKELDVGFVEVLDATPAGNYLGADVLLSQEQLEEIIAFQVTVNTVPQYRSYPSVSARPLLEEADTLGCAAGNALIYVDNSGELQACDLLQISFGNVFEEPIEEIYARMKAVFPHFLRGRCPAQTMSKEIQEIHERTGQLPLRYDDAGPVLAQLRNLGLPDHFATITAKRGRKRFRDFLR